MCRQDWGQGPVELDVLLLPPWGQGEPLPLVLSALLCFQEKEDKAHLQAEVQHLREDNLRLQEESQNASDKLKKFTEWVFNTIDMS